MTRFDPDMILATLESGDAESAERMCRTFLAEHSNDSDVLVLLAVSLWRQERKEESLETYAELTRLYPEVAVHWRNYSTALRQAGCLDEAEAASGTALGLVGDDPEMLHLHGQLLVDMGRKAEARDFLLRAFGQAPDDPAIRIHAALVCAATRDPRSEGLLRPWRTWKDLDDGLKSELAEAHEQNGNISAALELLEELAIHYPQEASLRLRLGGLYERVNQLDRAEMMLARVASEYDATGTAGPLIVRELQHQRARLAVRRRAYGQALSLLQRMGPLNDSDYAYWFELAAAHDKLHDPAAAMEALTHAHALQIARIHADHPHWFGPNSRALPQQNPRTAPEDYAAWPRLASPDASQSPVFVVGFPRSGTTLLEQMLDAHPQLQSMDERPFFNMLSAQLTNSTGLDIPHDLGRLNQRDCDELRKGYLTFACSKIQRRWDARLVDKNPMNMLWLPMMYRMFPNAKYILAIRDPRDVLLSCYMQNFMATTLGIVCENLQALAHAYVGAMEHWLYHVDLFKPDVFVSRYEDLVADPAKRADELAEFLGLDQAAAMLQFDRRAREKGFIATPSYSQVIEPINAKGIGRWKQYRAHFDAALPILEPMLRRWGYTIEL